MDAGGTEVLAYLQSFDDLLVMRRIVSKADLQLSKETAAALKRLLLVELQKHEEWKHR